MKKLNINIEECPGHPNCYIIHFDGDFDGYAKENLVDIQKFVDGCTGSAILLFDFNKLNYLNSYAIGHLVAWHNHLSKMGGKILIAGTNKNVEDIFAILGISNLFEVYSDLESAKKSLEGK